MNRRTTSCALLAAAALTLTACATSTHGIQAGGARTAISHDMSAGMVMPDGSTMGAISASPTTAAQGRPSAAELMICAGETRSDVAAVLGLKAKPSTTSSWRNHVYTCTYRLPMGNFVVSVKQSSDRAAAHTFFEAGRSKLPGARKLDGLGEGSYGANPGTVVLIKDNDVLTVDATRLPAVFGSQQSKRFDFAYEIASDILGCWTNG
jgi:hypothetical protein